LALKYRFRVTAIPGNAFLGEGRLLLTCCGNKREVKFNMDTNERNQELRCPYEKHNPIVQFIFIIQVKLKANDCLAISEHFSYCKQRIKTTFSHPNAEAIYMDLHYGAGCIACVKQGNAIAL